MYVLHGIDIIMILEYPELSPRAGMFQHKDIFYIHHTRDQETESRPLASRESKDLDSAQHSGHRRALSIR